MSVTREETTEITECFAFKYRNIQIFPLACRKDGLEARFEELDVDKSGFLEKEELKKTLMKELALWPMEANSLVDDCDKNKDGKIDKAEFLVMWANLFG